MSRGVADVNPKHQSLERAGIMALQYLALVGVQNWALPGGTETKGAASAKIDDSRSPTTVQRVSKTASKAVVFQPPL